ncbi:MAG: arylsulfatase [Halioglobus sp.]|nr:arylsulfatase [Halioglobus sp.]
MISIINDCLRRPARALSLGIVCAAGALVGATGWAASADEPPVIPQVHAPANAPNVVVVLLDDVGFGAASTFGGPSRTPALNALAKDGLRYNRFHTTAICSPTRASLLTGRDSHVANVGAVLNSANSYPGYQGVLKKETATIAQMLREKGYNTAAFGKWHLAPAWETSPSGPFDRWPTGVGFEKFYGFLGGETDQFDPTLYEGTTPILRPAGDDYHLSEDLVDQAIRWMRVQHSVTPDKPFFMYLATGATHAPLQVPREWIERYTGQFNQGWDVMREDIIARQKKLGVIPADARLTPRPAELPAWDSMGKDEQRVASRLMETYAAFLAHTDAQVGRLVQALKDSGQYDNTLFIYIVGDNGSSAEGGLKGSINYMGALQGLQESTATQLQRLDDIGNASTYAQYPAGWAWALTAPFQWVKQIASHLGGTRNPLVVTWPDRIKDRGGLRSQFSHVNDIAPTILAAVGLEMPATVDGVKQLPMDGSSLLPSFLDGAAPEHHTTQYFEVHGHRAIYNDGWMASARHDRLPWTVGVRRGPTPFEDDVWELYNLAEDYSQAHDLARENPAKLEEMKTLFNREAKRVGILPLRSSLDSKTPMPSLAGQRKKFTYYPGAVGIPEGALNLPNRSWSLSAELHVPDKSSPQGVIATMGGTAAGWSLYLDAQSKPVFEYKVFESGHIKLAGQQALEPGRQVLQVNFDYDGGGYAKGGQFTLRQANEVLAADRVGASPPAYFSIDETFDVGEDTGSPAGQYPDGSVQGYPFTGAEIQRVDIQLQ